METLIPILSAILIVAVLLCARFVFGSTSTEPWVKGLAAAQAAVTIIAVVIAGCWYLVEQPHAEKLKIDDTVVGVRARPGKVMVLAEITFTNLGSSVIKLDKAPLKVFLQQISPMPTGVTSESGIRDKSGALVVEKGENWGTIAEGLQQITAYIESAEVENRYYRVEVPCMPDLHVYFTIRMIREASHVDQLFGVKNYQYRKQTPVDLSQQCIPLKSSN